MVIITGASRGIGKLLFDTFLQRGEAVFGTCHSTEAKDARISRVDVRSPEEVKRWGEGLLRAERADLVLINCAGISYGTMLHKAEPEEWRDVIDTNLVGVFNATRTFLPRMREEGFGRIINFSSIVATVGTPGTSAYAASKAGLWGLARTIAVENGRKNITANNINLGYAELGMGDYAVPEAMKRSLLEEIPAGRFCRPEEIVSAVDFLIANAYVNGASLNMNGGMA